MFYWRFTITIIIIVKLENLSLYFVNISVVFRSYSRVILLLFLDMIEIILYRMCIYNPFQTQHCHCKIDGVDSWNNLWIDNEQVHKTWIGFYSADNKTNTDRINPQRYYYFRAHLTTPNGRLLLDNYDTIIEQ